MLTTANYSLWEPAMEDSLRAKGMWYWIHADTPDRVSDLKAYRHYAESIDRISKIPKCSGVLWSAPENWELWEFWEEVGPSRNRPEFQEQAGAPEVPWNKPLLQCTPECSGGLRRAQESPGVALGSTL
jgi:hypothetical protein